MHVDDKRDDYNDCLAKLNFVVEKIISTCITIVGDFNANLSKQSMFDDILLNFCKDNNFDIVDKDIFLQTHIHMLAQHGAQPHNISCCMFI